ncbi:hypothetical protein L596_000298 [Steinernema carpocapsae]|uniref:Uncharacterized protein n=1 Tax=Steinernema carpocapsae TaxID=34508 RepID=A0A4U8ULY6_STECR|nr:hypothetical protein L596_000298 [Steinernema carpocapsae]
MLPTVILILSGFNKWVLPSQSNPSFISETRRQFNFYSRQTCLYALSPYYGPCDITHFFLLAMACSIIVQQ